jgi:hypothetical protein
MPCMQLPMVHPPPTALYSVYLKVKEMMISFVTVTMMLILSCVHLLLHRIIS